MNNFHGTIPATFAKGSRLTNLVLNGNQLEGQLPRSLLHCRLLEVLDLGNNKINDTFPHWLENLRSLKVLVLRSNRFHGPVRSFTSKVPFPMLRIMDISHNEFTGLLPEIYFKTMKALMSLGKDEHKLEYIGEDYYKSSVMVTMKGKDVKLVKILSIFAIVDFCSNSFDGRIPQSIGNLKTLKGLNFSHNKLEGNIALSIGNLRNLEWLDLSFNKLTGEIPMQLVKLTFLSVLNLSENQLVGPLPQGKQFNTFNNDSYGGNLGLCGLPLSKTCDNTTEAQQPSPAAFEDEDESDPDNGFSWRSVLLGYGCGMIFGLLMGSLAFQIGRPKWLVELVEGKQRQKGRSSNRNVNKRLGRRRH